MKKRNHYIFSILYISIAILIFQSCQNDDEATKEVEWNYESPDKWGSESIECDGKVQSPINIETSSSVKAVLPTLDLHYKNSSWGIVNNGHTLQVNLKQKNFITLNGVTFSVKQFHFHRKSEHQIDGNSYDMELHIVHQDSISGDISVIALLIKQGQENSFISKIWNTWPSEKNKELISSDSLNLNDLLPESKKYFTYTGSLTTPPCTQGVDWIVIKEPIYLSADQITKFSSIYPNNERPVQPLNFRQVLESL